MILVESGRTFPLDQVKPLDRLRQYRDFCVESTKAAISDAPKRRAKSFVGAAPLEPFGDIDGLAYARCPETGSIFLETAAEPERWGLLLRLISRYRRSPEAVHSDMAESRRDIVYQSKVEWIQNTLRFQEMGGRVRLLEVTTPPSDLTALLAECETFANVETVDETEISIHRTIHAGRADAAVLLESADRAEDPAALLRAVFGRLEPGGILFLTAALCSGFDMAVLGTQNRYLHPPDRANCFSLAGVRRLIEQAGFELIELSTPGVLDVETVLAHLQMNPGLPLSSFERQILSADAETRAAFQMFLQQSGMSSFARVAARKPARAISN